MTIKPRRFRNLALLLLAAAITGAANAQTITRGPYLQMLSKDAVTIRWQTDVASNSRVRYGNASASLTNVANETAMVTEHEIRLNGLSAATTYYYAVGTGTADLAGGDDSYRFKTAPQPGAIRPVRVWVLGDSGTAGDGTGRAESVRDGYYNSALYKDPDFWMMLGDNAYNNGTEAETTSAIFNSYPTMLRKAALWSTIGNHETYTNNGAAYFNAFSFPTAAESGGVASGSERYYSFDYANIHFVCLDDRLRDIGGTQLTWLEDDLSSTTQKWIIAFWHAPPYSKGSHDSDAEPGLGEIRARFLPILESHGVDLVLCGHSHSYERSMLINGHYGLSSSFDPATMAKDTGDGSETGGGVYRTEEVANQGTVYVVAGNSGKISGGALNHPIMVKNLNSLGSMILDVNDNRLDVREIGADGLVKDQFSIVKGPLVPKVMPLGWASVNDHAGVPRALTISDGSFIEPRQAGIRDVQITFSGDIAISDPATAVTVTGVGNSGSLDLGALRISVSAQANGAVLSVTFSDGSGQRALPDTTKWSFSLNPAVISGTGGEVLPESTENTRMISALVGDVSGNGTTSGIDLLRISNSGPFDSLDQQDLRADINGDGLIDSADQAAAWLNRTKRTDQLPQP